MSFFNICPSCKSRMARKNNSSQNIISLTCYIYIYQLIKMFSKINSSFSFFRSRKSILAKYVISSDIQLNFLMLFFLGFIIASWIILFNNGSNRRRRGYFCVLDKHWRKKWCFCSNFEHPAFNERIICFYDHR